MLATRYADKKLSLSETDAFNKHIDNLPWNSGTGQSIYIQQATAKVRNALATEETTHELLQSLCAHFTDSQSRLDAFRRIKAIVISDGIDPKESEFLSRIQTMLNP